GEKGRSCIGSSVRIARSSRVCARSPLCHQASSDDLLERNHPSHKKARTVVKRHSAKLAPPRSCLVSAPPPSASQSYAGRRGFAGALVRFPSPIHPPARDGELYDERPRRRKKVRTKRSHTAVIQVKRRKSRNGLGSSAQGNLLGPKPQSGYSLVAAERI